MNSVKYRELYDQHAKAVYSTIYRMVQHAAEAEDLMQETFLIAFQKLPVLKEEASFRPWIKRIAINKTLESLRKNKIRFCDFPDDQMEAPDDSDTIDENLFEFQVEEIKGAIAALPIGYRTIVQLYLFEELSQQEIAVLLGLAPVTVRTQYHRARTRILKTIQKGGKK